MRVSKQVKVKYTRHNYFKLQVRYTTTGKQSVRCNYIRKYVTICDELIKSNQISFIAIKHKYIKHNWLELTYINMDLNKKIKIKVLTALQIF